MDGSRSFALESLEQRALLSSSFASVGMAWSFGGVADFDAQMITTEGTLADDLTVSGSFYEAQDGDRERLGDLWYDSVFRLEGGRFDRDPAEGFLGPSDERNAVWFASADGYPVGWWLSENSGGPEDAEFLVTMGPDVARSDYESVYQYSTIYFEHDDDEVDLSVGRMAIDDDGVFWSPTRGDPHRPQSPIDRLDPFGSLVTADEEYFYLSADGSTVVYADMSESERVSAIGVATKPASEIDPDALVGVFLTLYADGFGDTINFVQLAIEFEADGDYKFYNLDDYDDGIVESIERGFWRIEDDLIILEERDLGIERTFKLGENGSTLLGVELSLDDDEFAFFALGSKLLAEPAPQDVILNVPAVDDLDRPLIFQLETDDVWYVADVIADIGGPVPIGEIVSWVDPKDGLSYGAAVTSQGLVLYTESAADQWSFRNLTQEVSGGVVPDRELDVMTGPDQIVHLTALAADGDLLHYAQTGAQDDAGEFAWSFENITEEDLVPNGAATPDFSGLVSYATSWNGLNVVGLDDSGNIWGVWTAPGQPRWFVSNLTSVYGAVPLAGGLTVYLTPWSGINIAGIDDEGHLQVTWWVPSFGGDWSQSDLTLLTGGRLYEPERLGSFVSSWGGLNIVGADRDTGEVLVTWWAPANSGHGWRLTNLTNAVPAGSPVIAAPFTGIAATDASLNVFGYADTDFVRYYWEPGFGGSWLAQTLTDIAVSH